ncbi:MAG: hypothetical protein KatS3mg057_2709 [Herpetosiphonaceae bacterium]|nr:MAG: hypothetical protein KatS3mg057_2709 [Herpetosiphonaceae bacterium]
MSDPTAPRLNRRTFLHIVLQVAGAIGGAQVLGACSSPGAAEDATLSDPNSEAATSSTVASKSFGGRLRRGDYPWHVGCVSGPLERLRD